MELNLRHRWDVSPAEAINLQRQLREHMVLADQLGPIQTVAGVDCGLEQQGKMMRAAVAVLDFPALTLREQAVARLPVSFPYVPGLLSFREIPAVLLALEQLSRPPDLLLVDGQGYAHPRRFGIACHLGVMTNLPSIGVAKTRLVGRHDEPPNRRGQWVPLLDRLEMIGAVLRTREGVKPIYISPGHRVGFDSAVRWVMACVTRYRLPETTRFAHRLASGH